MQLLILYLTRQTQNKSEVMSHVLSTMDVKERQTRSDETVTIILE